MKSKAVFRILIFFNVLILYSRIYAQENIPPYCPLGTEWKFVPAFSDEFNGQGLDRDKWWDFNPTMHGRKPGFFARENVAVAGGCLQLTAKVQKPEEVTEENKVRGYDKFTTANVKSKQRIRYGYFEARCKPMKSGASSSFWLYDPLDAPEKYKEGSFSEEIDIFEVFGKPAKNEVDHKYFMTVHRQRTPYVETLVKSAFPLENRSASVTVPFNFYDEFHLYCFLWTPVEMKWYIDGKEVFSRKNDYFHTRLNVLFNTEIMEAWAGLPDTADLPAIYYVDYLRVWQKEGMF